MAADDLNQAIQLIQAGQPAQAQPLLEAILQDNPKDLAAWSWYVKSCTTTKTRREALEVCLKFNPGNPEVSAAIQKLQAKLAAAQPAQAPVSAFHETDSATPSALTPYAAATVTAPLAAGAARPADDDTRQGGLDENPGRPFIWYDVWFKALTQANVGTYDALLRDPLASPGRAYWWIFMGGLVTGLVSLIGLTLTGQLSQLSKVQGAGNFATLFAVFVVVSVPLGAGLSVLGLMFSAAIYNLLAQMFGGTGNFSRTVYLMGAYTAPFSIAIGIISLIPLVNCLTIPLSFYSFLLIVVTIQASQRLNGGRATIVALLPSLLILLLGCIGLVLAWPAIQAGLSSLSHYQR